METQNKTVRLCYHLFTIFLIFPFKVHIHHTSNGLAQTCPLFILVSKGLFQPLSKLLIYFTLLIYLQFSSFSPSKYPSHIKRISTNISPFHTRVKGLVSASFIAFHSCHFIECFPSLFCVVT